MLLKSYAFGLAAALLWGIVPVIMKTLTLEQSPWEIFVYRIVFSSLLLLPFLVSLKNKWKWFKNPKIIFATLSLLLTFFIQIHALEKIPASIYILVFGLSPLMILITDAKTRTFLSVMEFVLILVGLGVFSGILGSGLFAGITNSTAAKHIAFLDWILLALAVISWNLSLFLMSRSPPGLSSIEFSAITNWLSLIILSPLVFVGGLLSSNTKFNIQNDSAYFEKFKSSFNIEIPDLGSAISIMTVSLFLLAAMLLFHRGLKLFNTETLKSQYLEPIFGVALAIVFLNEPFQENQILGTGIIALGLGLGTGLQMIKKRLFSIYNKICGRLGKLGLNTLKHQIR